MWISPIKGTGIPGSSGLIHHLPGHRHHADEKLPGVDLQIVVTYFFLFIFTCSFVHSHIIILILKIFSPFFPVLLHLIS